MTNQTAIVTCNATTKKGKPCKNQAMGNGFCNVHQAKELLEKKKTKRSGAARKSAKNKPLPGATEELSSLIGVTANPEPSDGTTTYDFVNGVEVPVDVAADVVKISEDIAAEDELERPVADAIDAFTKQGIIKSDIGYSMFEALQILDQYKVLLKYVPVDKVQDKVALAEVLVDVVRMSHEAVEKESLMTTELINKLSLKVKYMREDAKAEYGEIPLDIAMDIEVLDKEIFQLKCAKGILEAAIELHEEGIQPDEPVVEDKPSLWDKVKRWFKNLPTMMIVIGAILMLIATVVSTGDTTPPAKQPQPIVGEHVPANFADIGNAKPVVVPDAPVAAVEVVVHDGDTLWDIAVKVYGDGTQWVKIWDANQDTIAAGDVRNLDDPGHWIHAGQVLHVDMSDSLNDH